MYIEFVDLEKAYDKVLRECGVDGYLTRSISSLYDGSRSCGRFGSRAE